MLTEMLLEQTVAAIVNGDGLSFADSSEVLWGRTADYRRIELSLFDSLPSDEVGHEAHLLGHSMDLGMVSSAGLELKSGGSLRCAGKRKR
jgi:membrane-anchored protein YejM (alkaline phosphatase superfamily)